MRASAIFLGFVFAAPCHALDVATKTPNVETAPFTVGARFDGEPVAITSTIVIPYTVVPRLPLQIEQPDWQSALPEELEVVNVERVTRSLQSVALPGQRQPGRINAIEFRLELSALAPGVYTIEPIEFTAVLPERAEEVVSVASDAVTVTIESILTEGDTTLADIKDPIDPPPDYVRIGAYVVGGVLAAALLAVGIAVIARRRPEVAPEPPTPAHVTAISEIDALLATDLIERRRWKAYFGELSGVLRRYIEGRFDLHAPTQTTEEFLRDPRMTNMFEPKHDALVRGFLGQADMVKFAEGSMNADGARQAAERVRAFVEETGVHSAHEEAPA